MRALVKRIKYAVKDLSATVLLHDGRILVSDFDDLDECIRRVTKVFGVHSVCPAVEMPKDDFDALCNQAVAMMADLSGTFRVTRAARTRTTSWIRPLSTSKWDTAS